MQKKKKKAKTLNWPLGPSVIDSFRQADFFKNQTQIKTKTFLLWNITQIQNNSIKDI